jgi:hypothetical protein
MYRLNDLAVMKDGKISSSTVTLIDEVIIGEVKDSDSGIKCWSSALEEYSSNEYFAKVNQTTGGLTVIKEVNKSIICEIPPRMIFYCNEKT